MNWAPHPSAFFAEWVVCPRLRTCRPGWLRCAFVSHRRSGSGVDRGQEVSPLPDFEPVWCVVAMPEVGVSTPQAFRDWDSLCLAEGLTARASADKLEELSRAYASAFAEAIPEGRQGVRLLRCSFR